LCRNIHVYNIAHLSEEGRAILWVEATLEDAALVAFQNAHVDASATASTAGIEKDHSLRTRAIPMHSVT
jgi:hypothetical protein